MCSAVNSYQVASRGTMSLSLDIRRPKPPAAGILNAKTLAEENLKGFRLKNIQKDGDIPLRVNQPQRIELPIYFNTPRRQEDIICRKRLQDK